MAGSNEFALAVRRGANLPEEWTEEKITAVVRMLPTQFQTRGDSIAFLALAHRYDLDPFAKEIYGWEDKGRFVVFVPRDGLLKKVREAPNLHDPDIGVVYSGDTFEARKDPETGKVALVHNTNPFAADAEPIGAYCLIRGRGDEPDTLVTRKLTDYAHLRAKSNWQKSPIDMLTARVTSAAARLRITLSGVYSPEDFEIHGDDVPPPSGGNGTKSVSDRLSALRTVAGAGGGGPEAPAPEEGVQEAEYEIVENVDEGALELEHELSAELPPGYLAVRGSPGWYRLVSAATHEEVVDRNLRRDEALAAALDDVEAASGARGNLDKVTSEKGVAWDRFLDAWVASYAKDTGLGNLEVPGADVVRLVEALEEGSPFLWALLDNLLLES